LPEPLFEDPAPGPASRTELADSLSLAMLVLLERLTPVERAAYLLREVFGYEYAEIAGVIERTEVNSRQLVTRARKHLEAGRSRFDADEATRDLAGPATRVEDRRVPGLTRPPRVTGRLPAAQRIVSGGSWTRTRSG
jgi:hypothetical protein